MVFLAVRSNHDIRRLIWIIIILMTINCTGTVYYYMKGYIETRMSSYYGSLGQSGSNEFALLLLQILPFAFLLIRKELFRKDNIFILFSTMTFLYCLTRTRSRTGFLGLILIFLFLFFIKRFTAKRFFFVLLIAIVLFIKTPTSFFERMATITQSQTIEEDRNVSSRFESAAIAFDIILDHPIMGVGLGNFIPYIKKNYHHLDLSRVFVVHNGFLLIGAECGIPAMLCFFIFVFSIVYNMKRIRISYDNDSYIALFADGIFCSILIFCFGILFQPTVYGRFFYIITPIAINLISNTRKSVTTGGT
jgi:O-antigen ligase